MPRLEIGDLTRGGQSFSVSVPVGATNGVLLTSKPVAWPDLGREIFSAHLEYSGDGGRTWRTILRGSTVGGVRLDGLLTPKPVGRTTFRIPEARNPGRRLRLTTNCDFDVLSSRCDIDVFGPDLPLESK